MIDGIVLLNKKKNITSFSCLRELRKYLNVKKIGHTGTLDIDAQGLLVCLIGNACKLQNNLMNTKKEYIAELIIGIETDTEDITGNILNKKNVFVDRKTIKTAISSFLGEYMQIPPMYSSKKVNGRKLLDYIKKGIELERKPCKIYIYNIDILDEYKKCIENEYYQCFKIKILCSKGTYIRTLCKDIGKNIGIYAVMGELFRTKTSGFDIKDANTLIEIKNKIEKNDYSFVKNCLYLDKPQVVCFGKFETLHLGHKKIIDKTVDLAKSNNFNSTVIIINDLDVDNNILNKTQQLSIIKSYGVDNVLYFNLNIYNKNMSASWFIDEILINQTKIKKLVIGEDATIGKNKEFNAELIKKYLMNKNIDVEIIKKIKISDVLNENEIKKYDIDKNIIISSTLIKKLINEKKIELVKLLIGRNFNNL